MHTYIQESKRWEFIFGETKLSSSILELAREWGLRQGRESSVVLKLVIIPGEALYWKYKSPAIRTPDLRELAPPSLYVLDVISKIGQKLQPPPTQPLILLSVNQSFIIETTTNTWEWTYQFQHLLPRGFPNHMETDFQWFKNYKFLVITIHPWSQGLVNIKLNWQFSVITTRL